MCKKIADRLGKSVGTGQAAFYERPDLGLLFANSRSSKYSVS